MFVGGRGELVIIGFWVLSFIYIYYVWKILGGSSRSRILKFEVIRLIDGGVGILLCGLVV